MRLQVTQLAAEAVSWAWQFRFCNIVLSQELYSVKQEYILGPQIRRVLCASVCQKFNKKIRWWITRAKANWQYLHVCMFMHKISCNDRPCKIEIKNTWCQADVILTSEKSFAKGRVQKKKKSWNFPTLSEAPPPPPKVGKFPIFFFFLHDPNGKFFY